ncbi:hypothetical protein MMC16_002527 [Acarospora aff. strigata]|nr:hypothetical protein [Acarospora aff. strigata]
MSSVLVENALDDAQCARARAQIDNDPRLPPRVKAFRRRFLDHGISEARFAHTLPWPVKLLYTVLMIPVEIFIFLGFLPEILLELCISIYGIVEGRGRPGAFVVRPEREQDDFQRLVEAPDGEEESVPS